ncbi:MAG: ATP-binding cassette domain-containing protein [Oscillospiraceae bacterium]|nr:ATP-binding cassette domain-containing protein [Oscillospiraceae bacterium]
MIAIETVNLTKIYKDIKAVENLNLQLRQGELLSLLGINGAGKTTTVKLLSGLTQPTCGDAFLMGKSVCKETAAVKSLMAVSPQKTAVATGLTARENLELMCGIHGLGKKEQKEKTAQMSALLGLESVLDRKAGKLSGGWQRRLSIAMALISQPQVLFLDEPTLGVDVIARSDLWEIIKKLKGRCTIVLTTHYMEEAQALSDRVAIMKEGKLLICDTVEKIKEKANTEDFEQAFIRIVKGEI